MLTDSSESEVGKQRQVRTDRNLSVPVDEAEPDICCLQLLSSPVLYRKAVVEMEPLSAELLGSLFLPHPA